MDCPPRNGLHILYDPSLPPAFAIAKLFKCRTEDIFQP